MGEIMPGRMESREREPDTPAWPINHGTESIEGHHRPTGEPVPSVGVNPEELQRAVEQVATADLPVQADVNPDLRGSVAHYLIRSD